MNKENYLKLKKVIQEAVQGIVEKFEEQEKVDLGIGLMSGEGSRPTGRINEYEREIRLADVLAAYKKVDKEPNFKISETKRNYLIDSVWNLTDNNLDHQSDECKEFLCGLLTQLNQ